MRKRKKKKTLEKEYVSISHLRARKALQNKTNERNDKRRSCLCLPHATMY
jgi:hypothetical protein